MKIIGVTGIIAKMSITRKIFTLNERYEAIKSRNCLQIFPLFCIFLFGQTLNLVRYHHMSLMESGLGACVVALR